MDPLLHHCAGVQSRHPAHPASTKICCQTVTSVPRTNAGIASNLEPRISVTYATNFYWHAPLAWFPKRLMGSPPARSGQGLKDPAANISAAQMICSVCRHQLRRTAQLLLDRGPEGRCSPTPSRHHQAWYLVTAVFAGLANMSENNGVRPRGRGKPGRTRRNFPSTRSCH